MKGIAIILLIAVGVYLYLRAQRLAREEQQQAEQPTEKEVAQIESDSTAAEENANKEDVSTPLDEGVSFDKQPTEVANDIQTEQAAAEPEPKQQDESWANDKLASALIDYRNASENAAQHSALLLAVAECYKQRKQTQYRDYGAGLQQDYLEVFAKLDKPAEQKGVGFMHLATLLNDSGQYDTAIAVCQQAINYGLTDGTVTGFEGRITRIERAKAKAAQ